MQYALSRKVERLSGPDEACMILPWAAHIDGARLDLEAACPFRNPEVQNCVRSYLRGRLARDPSRIGPNDWNDPGKKLDAGSGRGSRKRFHHGCGGVPRHAGERAEARH